MGLTRWARVRGYAVAMARPEALKELRAEIETRRLSGQIDEAFYQAELTQFRYPSASDLERATAVIVLSVPRQAERLIFELPDGPFETFMPPAWTYSATAERVRADLAEHLGKRAHLESVWVPLKLLAARLGLVAYGRPRRRRARRSP